MTADHNILEVTPRVEALAEIAGQTAGSIPRCTSNMT